MTLPAIPSTASKNALALAAMLAAAAVLPAAPPPPSAAEQAALTPRQALERLQAGNARFVAGRSEPRDWAALRARTAAAQHPFAVVLGCIDSRTAAEIVFDQGLGDIFSPRVAGNVLGDDTLGGMEFACQAAGAKLIVVVGHTACGAVAGAVAGGGEGTGPLAGLLAKIRPAVAAAQARHASTGAAVDAAAEENVRRIAAAVTERSAVLRGLVAEGKLRVAAAMHDLGTGRVRFLEN